MVLAAVRFQDIGLGKMGLFDLRKTKCRDEENECVRVPFYRGIAPRSMPNIDIVENYHPAWSDEFPDLPIEINGVRAIKSRTMRDDLSVKIEIAKKDWPFVEHAIGVANEQLRSSFSLASFPHFFVTVPDDPISDEWNPEWGNYCLLLLKPFTARGNKTKYPFVLKVNTRSEKESVSSSVSLYPDGKIGRIESTLMLGSIAHDEDVRWYTVVSTDRDGLVVSRISASLPDPKPGGSMPTLYTLDK